VLHVVAARPDWQGYSVAFWGGSPMRTQTSVSEPDISSRNTHVIMSEADRNVLAKDDPQRTSSQK
jgi:hypothetical protein